MLPMTPTTWPTSVDQTAAALILDPDDIETWRHALVCIWLLIHRAPATILDSFGMLKEEAIQAEADIFYEAGVDAPSELAFDASATVGDRLLRMAGWLRAAERRITETDRGSAPGDPNVDWLQIVDREPFFLVPMPRSVWRAPDAARPLSRTFVKRALLRFRVLPGILEGLPVRLTDGRGLSRDRTNLTFGASLFADFDIIAEDEQDPDSFEAAGVVGPTAASVVADVVQAAERGCVLHVFPELSLVPGVRAVIPATLAEAPWRTAEELSPGPDFVVAGSWHERYGVSAWNEAQVYDAAGRELLRFRKLFRYRDKLNRYEKIETGDTLEVLVTRMGLFGFGICLDLCQLNTPVLPQLDVDWLIVPSCGDWRTMQDHLIAARASQLRFDTRCFIVQQIFPKSLDKVLGYVLAAPATVGSPTEAEMRVSRSFTTHMTVAGTPR